MAPLSVLGLINIIVTYTQVWYIIEIVKQPNILFLSFFLQFFLKKLQICTIIHTWKRKIGGGNFFIIFCQAGQKYFFLRLNIHLRTSAPLSNQLENHLVFSQTSLVKKEWNSAICCVAINTLDITDYPA